MGTPPRCCVVPFVLALAACGPTAAVEPEHAEARGGDETETETEASAGDRSDTEAASPPTNDPNPAAAQEAEPEESWQSTLLACEDDSGCGLCFYGRIYETSADCECVDCPFDLVAPEECGRRARSYQEVCADQDERCPSFSCLESPEMRCIEGRCAVRAHEG